MTWLQACLLYSLVDDVPLASQANGRTEAEKGIIFLVLWSCWLCFVGWVWDECEPVLFLHPAWRGQQENKVAKWVEICGNGWVCGWWDHATAQQSPDPQNYAHFLSKSQFILVTLVKLGNHKAQLLISVKENPTLNENKPWVIFASMYYNYKIDIWAHKNKLPTLLRKRMMDGEKFQQKIFCCKHYPNFFSQRDTIKFGNK